MLSCNTSPELHIVTNSDSSNILLGHITVSSGAPLLRIITPLNLTFTMVF